MSSRNHYLFRCSTVKQQILIQRQDDRPRNSRPSRTPTANACEPSHLSSKKHHLQEPGKQPPTATVDKDQVTLPPATCTPSMKSCGSTYCTGAHVRYSQDSLPMMCLLPCELRGYVSDAWVRLLVAAINRLTASNKKTRQWFLPIKRVSRLSLNHPTAAFRTRWIKP